jgi:hypothetical protein
MTREGVLRGYVRKGGAFEDAVAYAVLRPESDAARPASTSAPAAS